jgi:methanogenic corrinoid protein MtbC1
MVSISELPDEPQFTIKAVCVQTGVRAVTLRAWERRYNLLNPRRGQNKYRRYSEREVAILRWVKTRVDSGISISSAVSELNSMRSRGAWPEAVPILQLGTGRIKANPPYYYAKELYKALTCHDESEASEVLKEAQAGLDLTTVCLEVITPTLVEIGEGWFRGEVRITTEHFASHFLGGRLIQLFQAFPTRRAAPYIITGCAPGENHEIGVLMLSTLLRAEGYRVEYLGQDVPLADLVDYSSHEKPALICLGSTIERSAVSLSPLQEKLSRLKTPPLFAYGGQAFIRNPALRAKVSGIFMGETAAEAIANIRKLI